MWRVSCELLVVPSYPVLLSLGLDSPFSWPEPIIVSANLSALRITYKVVSAPDIKGLRHVFN